MDDFEGRNAVVTGAGSGIGSGIALSLAREGVNVVIADIDEEFASKTAEAARNLGVRAISVETDVSQRSAVENLADVAFREFGTVDILVNNAGVTWRPFRAIWDASQADYEWIMSVNFWGVFHGMHVFIPRMKDQPGQKHIVNTSSLSSLVTLPGHSAYTASKMAIDGLSLCAREECKLFDIGVSIFYVTGRVDSRIPSSERLRATADQSAERHVVPWKDYGAGEDWMLPITQQPDVVGPMVVQGIRDNDLFIVNAPAPSESIRERAEAIISAGAKRSPAGGSAAH